MQCKKINGCVSTPPYVEYFYTTKVLHSSEMRFVRLDSRLCVVAGMTCTHPYEERYLFWHAILDFRVLHDDEDVVAFRRDDDFVLDAPEPQHLQTISLVNFLDEAPGFG